MAGAGEREREGAGERARTVAFIPVRGGSVSIPMKNIRPLGGRPLVHWVMDAALGAAAIDEVWVASDSPEIRKVAAAIDHAAYGKLRVIDRSAATATNTASTESALLEFAEAHAFDRVVLIQATSPLLTSRDLDDGLAQMDAAGATSALSVVRQHRFHWKNVDGLAVPQNYDPLARPRRQDWGGELYENGAFYVTSRDALLATRCRISGPTVAVELHPDTAHEIDEPHDWTLIGSLLTKQVEGDFAERARGIKLFVTDCDGVLTDAGMYFSARGEELKRFSARDGRGLARLREAGISVALITGEDTDIVRRRAEKLKLAHVFCGVSNKVECLGALLRELGVEWHEVAYIGDDDNDLGVLAKVGIAGCPRDAEPVVKKLVHFTCTRDGGRGAVREFGDAILSARG